MGNTQSSEEEEVKSFVPNESHKSARNILESYAKNIRLQEAKDARDHVNSLKGELRKAEFRSAHFETIGVNKYGSSNPCYLDHKWYTNLGYDDVDERDPCHGRNQKRFDEDQESECGPNIRDYNSEDPGTACAPPRRRHLCDKNLEALTVENTKNSDDLLGNILVTAKYEGDYIVKNHPHKGTSDVCTALARSFADIGDIVRGIDMFKPNKEDAVQNGLRAVFKNIYDKLSHEEQEHYKDVDVSRNYYKLREDWWTANRDKVWKAITCNAPYKSGYFIQSESNTQLFSNEYCGHYEGVPLTNLDYVPQYLRWYDEWAEEFCRKKKIILENVKKACRKDSEKLYCSLNGYDCTQTIWKKRILHWDSKCTDCSSKCNLYQRWLGNQKEEFEKQKQKFKKEINGNNSAHYNTNNNINNKYYKDFYKKLKVNYKTVNEFINLLNEGKYCKGELPEEECITFTSEDDKKTFSRSQYCQVCPDCGVKCNNGTCEVKTNNDGDCGNNVKYKPPEDVTPTEITVLYSGDEQGAITKRLSEFCSDENKINGKINETWKCYYDSKNKDSNKCIMKTIDENNTDNEKIMPFHDFFHFWLTQLLTDTINWENELKSCINSNTLADCNNNCRNNCKCFQSWIDKKEKEWGKIKELFKNENNMPKTYFNDLKSLFEGYFFEVINKVKQGEAKWKELMDELRNKIESSNLKNSKDDLKDAIELLLEHLKETATICKDNNTIEACDSTGNPTQNPCVKNNNGGKVVGVKQIAQYFKRKAYNEANKRSNGLHKLKGKAHEGEYNQKGMASDLKNVCEITVQHSNRNTDESTGPCGGKDGEGVRFQVGTKWKTGDKIDMSHLDLYLPPRREHMCTSNLEHLQSGYSPLDGSYGSDKVNNSFLGDLLLAAKYEAEKTKKHFKDKNENHTACRAVRYSFADLGDIIRGRDLWEGNSDMVKLRGHLENIFKKIKDKVPGKYDSDPDNKQLREDWWEANRSQVWEAMKCAITELNVTSTNGKSSSHCGYSDHTPLDDYIPQRLRWMNEWAEWYCKMQKDEYDKLKKECKSCRDKSNGKKCMNSSDECNSCKRACEAYKGNIEPWEDQWKVISDKYQILFSKARVDDADNGGLDTSTANIGDKDKPVVDFLFNLYVQNGGKIGTPGKIDTTPVPITPYSTTGGYIHQELPNMDCESQTQFCEKENGETSSSDDKVENEKYDFKNPPSEYQEACACDENKASVRGPQVLEEPCEIVRRLLDKNNGMTQVGDCHPKNKGNNYPDWNCDKSLVKEELLYMPPRRQKLCLHYLKEDIKNEQGLRNAFIKSVAAETFFSWYYYKSKNGKKHEFDQELKEERIPPEFLRSMFYTFGDYRDICLDTDISAKPRHSDITKAKEKIGKFFKKEKTRGAQTDHTKCREEFWGKYGEHIWKGMLCALEKAWGKTDALTNKDTYSYSNVKFSGDNTTSLEEFSERPQFLRWLTEWYDDYCHTRQKYLKDVQENCNSNDQLKCDKDCNDKCNEYEKYMEKKKKEWNAQYEYYKEQQGKIDRPNGVFVKDYIGIDATAYLKLVFTTSSDDNPLGASEVQKNIQLLSDKLYYDANEHCGCKKFIKDDGYKKISGEMNCKGLLKEATTGTIKWGKKGTDYYDHLSDLPEDVFFSSRRKNMCFRGLDNYFEDAPVTDEKTLRKRLMEVASTEGYNLGKYYKEKKENETKSDVYKYAYHVEPCNAMKYSFYDLRDIILGTDNLEHPYSKTERNLNGIFKTFPSKGGQFNNPARKPGSKERQTWWKENEQCVWEAMKCGYKKGHGDNNIPSECDKMPKVEPIGSKRMEGKYLQFLRWFSEWSEDFCNQRKKQLEQLGKGCPKETCTNDQKDTCKSACKNYGQFIEKWKTEYKEQSKKYGRDKRAKKYDIHPVAIEANDALEYLSTQLKKNCDSGDKCNCMNGKSKSSDFGEDMPVSLNEVPEGYEWKCDCDRKPPKQEVKPPQGDNACTSVEKLFLDESEKIFEEACGLKYSGKYTRWNCNSDTSKFDKDGAVCIPPRRQKLYLKKLQQLNVQKTGALRQAFIQCASVETFFLWNKYKKDKEIEDKEKEGQHIVGYISTDPDKLDQQLNTGTIPDDFKRQMFYTFADYRDILFGKYVGSGKDIEEVKSNINTVFQKMKGENGNKRKKWWNENAKSIWDGMLCALTYKTETQRMNAELNIKLTKEYGYNNVTISSTPMSSNRNATKTTSLSDYASRPQYFRWFEEWAEEFCRKKKIKIQKIKHECRREDGTRYCDGDGFDCKEIVPNKERNFKTFNCPSCGKSCRSYKLWINTKQNEFIKQKKKYDKEIQDAKSNSHNISDKKFVAKLHNDYLSVDSFLSKLKEGPCCNDNTKDSIIDFNKQDETFEHSKLCAPCPVFGVECKQSVCTDIPIKVCGGKTFNATDDIKKLDDPIEKGDMLVSDNVARTFPGDLNSVCKDIGIFEGIRNDKWSCGYACGLDICNLNRINEKKDDKQNIQIRTLFKRWIEHFLKDYNKIKEKLNPCINNDKESICINTCKNKCDCVDKWIILKKNEWVKIRERYLKPYEMDDLNKTYSVRSFLENLQPEFEVQKVKVNVNELRDLEEPSDCANTMISEDGKCKKKDVIESLLNKLKKEIDDWKKKPKEETKKKCDETPLPTGDPNNPDNDNQEDDEYEESPEDTNSIMSSRPDYCPKEPLPQKPELPEKKEPCEIVNKHFSTYKNGNGENGINGCNKKEGEFKWNCSSIQFKNNEEGPCMPPRRQKLCINDLKVLKDQSSTKEELKNAFINCAAKEVFYLWKKYKEDIGKQQKDKELRTTHNSDKLQSQLKDGNIPEEFKRQMFYTFADYRDVCLGNDLGRADDTKNISITVTTILNKEQNSDKSPETWWNEIKEDLWQGMLCGLSHHIDDEEMKGEKLTKKNDYKYSTVASTLEDFACRPQFLRWFTEWGDEFCKKREEQLWILMKKCQDYECKNNDEKTKEACKNACKAYQNWLKDWKDQYKRQSAKFHQDKTYRKFDNTSAEEDINEPINAHEYLHEQLKKLCEDGKCSCMKDPSIQEEETELLEQNVFPEALDYPPKEFGETCKCAIPPEPMSCVERTAQKLRENAEQNIETTLKVNGKTYNGNCKNIEQNNYMTKHGGICIFKKGSLSSIGLINNECKNAGKDRFKIGEEWKCDEDTTDGKNRLCIPPRRKDMCLEKLKNILSTDITGSTQLLQKIQEVAKHEGDDIIINLLPGNPCNESVICDAMKYSFADIGDIVRGRSKIKTNNDDNTQEKLQKIFKQIQNNSNITSLKTMGLTEFREKWWDANRNEVWKAMTCNAPKDAYLEKKKLNNPGDKLQITITETEKIKKCGYNSDPPDYDYIPERYRFLQEWSEYYCKALNKKQDEFKNDCSTCLKNATCDDNKNNTCEECKKKCEDYSKFVDKWKAQFDEQNEIYKKLYTQAGAYGTRTARRDPSIKFLKKIEESCNDPHSAEEYLDKSTHCTEYLYPKNKNEDPKYAFSKYPKDYKDKCKCEEKSISEFDENMSSFIQNSLNFPKIKGLKKVTKIVPRLPVPIIDIIPDAHIIHKIVAESLESVIPKFHLNPDKTDVAPPTNNILNEVLPSAIPVGIALALGSIAFLFIKKKPKSPVDLLRVLDIHKGDYGIPTPKSSNRYIPYGSDRYKGKTYIYMEGDSSGDEKYAFMSDTTDVTSSESEYEEMDINDIYVPGSPKYKTLIEVVLEPSKNGANTPSKGDDTPRTTMSLTDEECNELKHDFISQYIQSEPLDVPQYDVLKELPMNIGGNVLDDGINEKSFITSIHDRDLNSGEEISYNIHMSTNSMDDPKYVSNNVYSGIDLINDTLSSNKHIDIYDEVLKRKENELFGTNYKKNTSKNSVAKNTNSDPIMNQLDLLHKWLDRHRDMCDKWNTKEELLDKLNEQWNKDNNSGDIPNDNKMLNTNVSFQIDMDETKGKKEFSNMDTILDDIEDDIYYDVNDDENPFVDDIPMDHNKVDVPKKVHVEMKIHNNTSNGSLEQEFPISDVWNI
ncbi:erythrocyte membrane protein 1 (PfEMP1), putative [Plasmodium sp. gorilla clade G1]|nr:erythrocyte membrane protein 1 (PfEMP1), putative [Plasmodium sp. gorilla clade G1]